MSETKKFVSLATQDHSDTSNMINLLGYLFDHFLHEASAKIFNRGRVARLSIVKHVTGNFMNFYQQIVRWNCAKLML